MNPALDTKSKVLFSVLFLGILTVILLSFLKFGIVKDFDVVSKVNCDPATEICFVSECDVENDPRCEGETIKYYKYTQKKAYSTPPLECMRGDSTCVEFHCSPDNQLLFETEDECSTMM